MPLASTSYGQYETLNMELNGKNLGNTEELLVSINNRELATVSLASQDSWKTLSINFAKQIVSLRGSGGAEYSQTFSTPFDDASLDYISLNLTPSAAGSLLIRPPFFSDSAGKISGGAQIGMLWTPESALLGEGTVFQTGLTSLQFGSSLFSPHFTETRGLESRIKLNGHLPFFLTSLFFRVYWDLNNDIHIDAFHDLSFDAIQEIGLTNSFSQHWRQKQNTAEISQNLGFSLAPVPWLFFKSEYQFTRRGKIQNRDWTFILNTGDVFFVHTLLRLGLDEGNIEAPHSNSSYLQNYAESLRFMDWSILKNADYRRSADAELSMGLVLENFSAEIDVEILTDYNSLPTLSENFIQGLQLGFYLDSGIDIVIDANQHFFQQDIVQTDDFFSQMSLLFQHGSKEPFFLAPLYFVGVFSDLASDSFFRSAGNKTIFNNPRSTFLEYSTDIEFSRNPDLGVYDLLVPAGLEIAVFRKLQWNQGLISDLRSLKVLLSWQVLNTFGILGRHPLFSTYKSDEIYMDIGYKQNLDQNDDLQIGGQFSPSFFDAHPFTLIENSFDWKWASKGISSVSFGIESSLRWITPLNVNLSDLFTGMSAEKNMLEIEHEETLKLRYTGLREDSSRGSFSLSEKPGFTITLQHQSALLFSSLGSFSLNFAIAYMAEALSSLEYAYAHRLGIEGNALLEISY